MKVIKTLPVFVVSAILLTACSTNSVETTQSPTQVESTHELEENVENLSESIESKVKDLETAPTAATTNSLEDLASYLKENNLIQGEPTGMPAEMLGAISGAKYGDVAIYEYEKESDSYKGLIENGYITLEGVGSKIEPSAINDKYMLLCDNAENRDEIIKVFMEYK
ncbi:hypothetical protein [Clostridium sp. HBUAS56010]|uniref:hypothetical protein n=1 Tax=Clostridium sp. HBUAS56010 TaxID=2571127 RepID=UPI001178B5B6|nr:hypothetical protein [Clostridium sp. HBUAS56010]